MLLSFATLVLQSSTMIFIVESLSCYHIHILVGIFHYRTWLVYSNDGLPQNSHHTYLLWHFHSHSKIYCHATYHRSVCYDTLHHCHIALHDHVVDIVFVAKPPFIIFIHVTLELLHIPVHRRRHSYRVIFCSKYRVVILEL